MPPDGSAVESAAPLPAGSSPPVAPCSMPWVGSSLNDMCCSSPPVKPASGRSSSKRAATDRLVYHSRGVLATPGPNRFCAIEGLNGRDDRRKDKTYEP